MKGSYYIAFLLAMIVMIQACKKAYLPPAIQSPGSYLVVEGVINAGSDSTIIKLSRTIKISDKPRANPELQANVTVESDAGSAYQLVEAGEGKYVSAGLNLCNSHKYRLKIAAADSKVYQSDFVSVRNSPPIDSANYVVKNNGVQININTHDATNSTRYYRWSYTETYVIHSMFFASVKLITVPFDTIVFRPADEQIYICWLTDNSANIVLGSSAKLAQDVMSQSPVTFIPSTSEKIGDRYSILVTQYALTEDAYNYWQQLKKNTEQLGSIFDAQPSEINGDIRCVTDPHEPVLGYVSAGSYTQTRLYVDTRQLPAWLPDKYITGCIETIYPLHDSEGRNEVKDFIYAGFAFPISAKSAYPGGPIVAYTASTRECVDCTLRGTNIQPTYWTYK